MDGLFGKDDGTTSGTVIVKDTFNASSTSYAPSELTAVGNTLFFSGYEQTNGISLEK